MNYGGINQYGLMNKVFTSDLIFQKAAKKEVKNNLIFLLRQEYIIYWWSKNLSYYTISYFSIFTWLTIRKYTAETF